MTAFFRTTTLLTILAFQFMAIQTTTGQTSNFDWQGHRGCRGLLPENTIPAFLKALEFPQIKTLELDLAVSADHQLIVSHEPWFNHQICLKPDGTPIAPEEAEGLLLYQMSAEEIAKYDCGASGNPRFPEQAKISVCKPRFIDVVQAVQTAQPNRNMRWNIEIKSLPEWDGIRTPPIDSFCQLVLQTIRTLGIADHCTIQSFDLRPLQILHREAPDIQLALLVENQLSFDANLALLGFSPDIYSPYYKFVDDSLVNQCHALTMKIVPWTVNEPADMVKLIEMGVDGIITDYPDRIRN